MAGIGFSHLLVQRAVYGGLCPGAASAGCICGRRAWWAGAGRWGTGWRRRQARRRAGTARELEAVGRDAKRHGRTAEAAAWLAQAAAISSEPAAADRRRLDALQILVAYGEVAQAETLAARVAAGPDPRRSWLLGTLDFLAGRTVAAEARLREAWRARDPARGLRSRAARRPPGWRNCALSRPGPGGDRMGRAGGRDRRPPGRYASPGPGRAGHRPLRRRAGA